MIPTHQGGAAEKILFSVRWSRQGRPEQHALRHDACEDRVTGAEAVDLVIAAGREALSDHPFKGNMDVDTLEALLRDRGDDVPCVMVTMTKTAAAASPSRSTTCAACAPCATPAASTVPRRMPIRRERLVHVHARARQ
jgi:tryptophanase